jgi:hypothetical protein
MSIVTRTVGLALLALATAGIAGCGVGSIAPLVPSYDAQYDSLLVGAWQDSSGKDSAVITPLEPRGYLVVYTDDGGKIDHFRGVLGRVGSFRVLDLEPLLPEMGTSDITKSLLLRLHAAVFVDAVGSELRFRLLEPDSLKRFLERRPRAIQHVIHDDNVVLTAPTAEVQRFMASYARSKNALGVQNVWKRRARSRDR